MTQQSPTAPLILIVDDNERNRRLAGAVLRAAGLRTIEAASGGEAVTLAAAHLPDVVLLDLELPDMHGAEVARKLREGARTAHIPLVAFSARPYAGEGDRLSAAGFAGYLEKPIDVATFPAQVRGYCGSVRA
jgi:two-component system cell cycle response regulator DivK